MKKITIRIAAFFLVSLVFLTAAIFVRNSLEVKRQISLEKAEETATAKIEGSSSPKNSPLSGIEAEKQKIAGEEDQKDANVLDSENFAARQINIGGGILMTNDSENMALRISDVRGETFTSKKSGSKALIAWNTSNPAKSQIEYSKNGQVFELIAEDSYNLGHSAVLSGLEPKASYVYKIKSRDKWGNETESDTYTFYSASEAATIFDTMGKAVSDIFGWVFKE